MEEFGSFCPVKHGKMHFPEGFKVGLKGRSAVVVVVHAGKKFNFDGTLLLMAPIVILHPLVSMTLRLWCKLECGNYILARGRPGSSNSGPISVRLSGFG